MLFLEHFGITDAGKVRQNNEDSLLVGEGTDSSLFAVADGVGGSEAGEVASGITVEALKELRPDAPFDSVIQEANQRILAAVREDEKLSGMGTTVVAVRFTGSPEEPAAEVAHVGDSRAYLLRGGEMKPLTEDHSLVAELVRSGDLTRAQAAEHPQKNLITRALGAEGDIEVDTMVLPIEAGDRFLLCSDGLSDMVPEDRIAEILAGPSKDPEGPARQLLSEALEAGGSDNITIVLVDVKKQEKPPPPPRKPSPPRAKSGETREMQAVSPTESPRKSQRKSRGERQRNPSASSRRRVRKSREKRRGGVYRRAISGLLRALAVVLVILVALTPAYLWTSSRYFLEFEDGEVVAYRGVPYEVMGFKLNDEWKRPGIERSDVKEPYQGPIEEQKLYTQSQVEDVLQDLRR
ncbi:protein phosphatase 2C domain-containing protein [soil metagenome]